MRPSGVATNTWTNYSDAGGTQGQTIGTADSTVVIACKIQGFRVADGNTYWYRIAQTPWNGAYYASADAFYNNGANVWEPHRHAVLRSCRTRLHRRHSSGSS
jgi:hypothetical protein